jgi:hypothetical protein
MPGDARMKLASFCRSPSSSVRGPTDSGGGTGSEAPPTEESGLLDGLRTQANTDDDG